MPSEVSDGIPSQAVKFSQNFVKIDLTSNITHDTPPTISPYSDHGD